MSVRCSAFNILWGNARGKGEVAIAGVYLSILGFPAATAIIGQGPSGQ